MDVLTDVPDEYYVDALQFSGKGIDACVGTLYRPEVSSQSASSEHQRTTTYLEPQLYFHAQAVFFRSPNS
jgi:hypothetical protein